MYVPGDFAADVNGAIFECWDLAYCRNDPASAKGEWGWFASPYSTSSLVGYDADTCVRDVTWVDLSESGYIVNLPAMKGDIIYDNADWAICTDTLQCRLS
jgi:hypothetical protein